MVEMVEILPNLLSRLLTHHQLEALMLGLKFAPTPKETPDPTEFFDKFQEKCTWVYSKVTGASKAKLPESIQARVDEMRRKLEDIEPKSFASNISKEVRTAIDQLRKIVRSPSEKLTRAHA